MKKCPKCGLLVSDSQKDCFDCGYRFPTEPSAKPSTEPQKRSVKKKRNGAQKASFMERYRENYKKSQKHKTRNGVIGFAVIALLLFIVFSFHGGKEESSSGNVVLDFSEDHYGEVKTDGLELYFGELLSVNQSERTVVVKAKTEPSLTNKMTVDQNFINAGYLIKKNGFNTCNELQYWAVADMTDGSESKVVQYTLEKDVIDAIFNETILDNQIKDHATDVWILPSLQD